MNITDPVESISGGPMPDDVQAYAKMGQRYQAIRIDGLLYTFVFVVFGILAGVTFEGSPKVRAAAFILIVAFILTYEPFMVSRYGATIGHRKAHIRVLCAVSGDKLPFWRATVRSVCKQILGLPSFLFMFMTHRAQSFHDIVARAVVVRDC